MQQSPWLTPGRGVSSGSVANSREGGSSDAMANSREEGDQEIHKRGEIWDVIQGGNQGTHMGEIGG